MKKFSVVLLSLSMTLVAIPAMAGGNNDTSHGKYGNKIKDKVKDFREKWSNRKEGHKAGSGTWHKKKSEKKKSDSRDKWGSWHKGKKSDKDNKDKRRCHYDYETYYSCYVPVKRSRWLTIRKYSSTSTYSKSTAFNRSLTRCKIGENGKHPGPTVWKDPYSGETYPICKEKDSDPDGDGWGWENEASCKVVNVSTYKDAEEFCRANMICKRETRREEDCD